MLMRTISLGLYCVAIVVSSLASAEIVDVKACGNRQIRWQTDSVDIQRVKLAVWTRKSTSWETVFEEQKEHPIRKLIVFNSFGDRIDLLPLDSLYRVTACKFKGSCQSSKVIWMPSHVCDVSKASLKGLPETVVVVDLMGMSVPYSVSTEDQMDPNTRSMQYNMYAVMRESALMPRPRPPMLKPKPVSFRKRASEFLKYNVYITYELDCQGWVDLDGLGVDEYFSVPTDSSQARPIYTALEQLCMLADDYPGVGNKKERLCNQSASVD